VFFTNAPPPASPKKLRAKPKQAGKKEGGLGEGIFARLICPPKADWGREAARPCVSKEAKPAKIVSLLEKIFCARPLKEKEIFAGFACPAVSGASRWAGLFKIRKRILFKESSNLVQKAPPNFTFSGFGRCCLGASRLGMVFFGNFPRHFQVKGERPLGNAEVRCAKHRQNEVLRPIFLVSALGGIAKRYFNFDCPKINLIIRPIWTA